MSLWSPEFGVIALYFSCFALLAVAGLHRYHLIRLYRRVRGRIPGRGSMDSWPRVTVQLPLYNEKYVAERLIRAAGALDYPRHLLDIQVLDDSTDGTRSIVDSAAARLCKEGVSIAVLRRSGRTGFKAGALAEGLERAQGEFIAIFDADFIPPPDFLRRVLPHFTGPRVAMVQARWEHLNRRGSLLTSLQAVLLDAHFRIEHLARNRAGCFFNFNGTAGVWRKAAIEDAGGWSHDTLTEDLDLSYRAQLRCWRFVYLDETACPSELPADINAFKSQQFRWARGSIQTARKLLPAMFRAAVPRAIKTEAWFHLTSNLGYPLVLAMALLLPWTLILREQHEWWTVRLLDLLLFLAPVLGIGRFYWTSQKAAEPETPAAIRLARIPLLMALGIGLSINNTLAVLGAFFKTGGDFVRTPKFGLEEERIPWLGLDYVSRATWVALAELAMTGQMVWCAWFCIERERWGSLPFVLLLAAGFGAVGLASLLQRPLGLIGQGFWQRPTRPEPEAGA